MESIITNARIVTGTTIVKGTLKVVDGKIAEIMETDEIVEDAIDFGGDYLLPGLIDVHTDHLEKQIMPRAGVFWNKVNAIRTQDAVLAAGGITTVFDSLIVGAVGNPDRRKILPMMIEGLKDARKAALLKVDHFLHLRCDTREVDIVDLLKPYLDEPTLRYVTIMDDGPLRDPNRYRKLEKRKGVSEEVIESEIAAAPNGPDLASENRSKIVALCKQHGIEFSSHDDTTAAHIAEGQGFGMTISEFPITMESAVAARAANMTTIIGGPNIVAGRSHIGNVSGIELAKDGLVDVICSDYIPSSILYAIWRLAGEDNCIELPAAVAMGSKRPAELFGLKDRGELAVGRRADLLRVTEVDGAPIVRNVWVEGGLAL
ncbi:alpha-D-ribose 1-methylphosphonate 5-triphosphate diphosphatase [Rhizobium miluonense]|uniref:Alpha-D-ribose 1-methylphosphonate 5-triphosphate diphosphatase n=1 Tax=Rhizobium miluonense TaxID=411945 RepID=A0A1C3WDZ4_9HYPH|nr:alpha-D-ribose 1-methylphosphonate 5-triphosphate diphosphatase [Rhizobium miluonense]SCB38250.1 alpha-D-ribose 1-methylphosphonate 5-triphosphate diphosphatase [Rhizobium miluonense]